MLRKKLYIDISTHNSSYFFPGGWSTDGVSVESVDDKSITCASQHLTSFAVLVDVSGSHEVLAT